MKKKLLLLCTFLISFIIYIDAVEAAEPLTCVYEYDNSGNSYPKYLGLKFTQDSNGNRIYYVYGSNKKWEEYTINKEKNRNKKKEYYDTDNKTYTKCPKHANFGLNPKNILFGEKYKKKWYKYKKNGMIEIALDEDGKVVKNNSNNNNNHINNSDKNFTSCKELFPTDSKIYEKMNEYMNIIRIAVPILLLVFGIIDFFTAIFGDEENMNKSKKKFAKRLLAAVIVFIIPLFVKLLLTTANKVWNNINYETCIK